MDGKTIDREPGKSQPPATAAAVPASTAPVPASAAAVPVSAAKAPAPAATLVGEARVILVRHGVTDFTVSGRLDGRGGADPELNAEGLAQAAAVARILPGLVGDQQVRLVTSSLRRTQMTGAAIAAALGVVPEGGSRLGRARIR